MKITINMLPQEHKAALTFKRKCNVALKLSIMASAAVVVYVLFVIACMQILEMEKRTVMQEIQNSEGSKGYRKVRDDQELIKDYHKMAGIIERGFSQDETFLPVFDTINAIVPAGITFEAIQIDAQKVTLKGIGKERQDVIDFKSKLEQEKLFGTVDAPISNFTQQRDVLFEFNIEFKDAKKSNDNR